MFKPTIVTTRHCDRYASPIERTLHKSHGNPIQSREQRIYISHVLCGNVLCCPVLYVSSHIVSDPCYATVQHCTVQHCTRRVARVARVCRLMVSCGVLSCLVFCGVILSCVILSRSVLCFAVPPCLLSPRLVLSCPVSCQSTSSVWLHRSISVDSYRLTLGSPPE
jgi:hypothetical protein